MTTTPTPPVPRPRPPSDDIDLSKYFFLFLENWYWFVLSVIICAGLAYLLNRYTIREYRVTATLLIEDEKSTMGSFGSGGTQGGTDVLSGFGLYPGMKTLENQILILQSYNQVNTTLHSTDFEVSCFSEEITGKREIYNEAPFIVSFDRSHTQPLGVTFCVTLQENGKLRITGETRNGNVEDYNYLTEKVTGSSASFTFEKEVSWGEQVEGRNFLFTLLPREGYNQNGLSYTYFFRFNSYDDMVTGWREAFELTPMKTEASIVELAVETDCPAKAMTFIDTHLRMYLQRTLDKKNQFAINTIEFIDEQLLSISDSLWKREQDLQDFRREKQVVDISFQAQQLFEQTRELENSRADLKVKSDYFRYLKGYLKENREAGSLVAPAAMGITDPLMNNLVLELNRMESQKVAMKGSDGSVNPYIATLESQIRNAKAAFEEVVMNMERNNNIAIRDLNKRLEGIMAEVGNLPQTERELFSIERQFKLNDNIYTYLLQRRSEAQIAKASNTPDNEIIDYARVEGLPIKPKVNRNYILGLIFGLSLPGFIFLLKEAFNYKIETEDEIKRITSLPLAGYISHNRKDYQDVVLLDPRNLVSEAFRNLRIRMRFFTREIKNPVILVTSSMAEEGKTFTALNLSSAYSLAGIRTVLLSFDLRKPRNYDEFGIDNEKGITTYLIGRDTIDDIIMETGHENLYITPAGPVPPNPSELASSEKTRELFSELKKRFDYIITDSAPIGAVSDTYPLASLADAVIMLVRHNKTIKQILKNTIEDCKVNGVSNLSILLNDIRSDRRMYGYRGRYGYTYGYAYGNHSGNRKKKT